MRVDLLFLDPKRTTADGKSEASASAAAASAPALDLNQPKRFQPSAIKAARAPFASRARPISAPIRSSTRASRSASAAAARRRAASPAFTRRRTDAS